MKEELKTQKDFKKNVYYLYVQCAFSKTYFSKYVFL